MPGEDETDSSAPVVVVAFRAIREGVRWLADTFRGHAHVREMKNERE
ncbi:MAG: hypothetical protein ACOCPT_05325 [Halanaeroarchaeum sp.]